MNKIAAFEALAERLVEGTFSRLFASRLPPLEVAARIARIMDDHQIEGTDGASLAPTLYWVSLHPRDYDALGEDRAAISEEIAGHVQSLARARGLVLVARPVIYLLPDPSVNYREASITARHLHEFEPLERTTEMGSAKRTGEGDEAIPSGEAPRGRPFLIVDGTRHINLVRPLVTIGRGLGNTVIIEDARVSREHAQLRLRFGRYVLYDLGSSGGTLINGYPVEECVLHSGDVISLAGVELIYGEDPPTPFPLPGAEDTPPLHGDPSATE